MTLLLALVAPALAQDAPCDASFDINRFIEGMNLVDASFEAFDAENAKVVLKSMYTDMACLEDRVHPRHLVRYARQRAMSAFFDQDELEMGYWAQLAGVDPDMPWPASVTPDHPVRDQLTFVLMEDPLTVDGVLTPPKGGGILLDGTLLLEPTTTPDAPHFVQVVDKNVTVLSSRWQDGVVFPSALLAKVGEPPTAIRNYTPPDPNLDPTQTVTIDAAELARRQASREEAEEQLAAARERAEAALEKERERSAKREAREARRAKRRGEEVSDDAVVEVDPNKEDVQTEWLELDFDGDKERLSELDSLEKGTAEVACEDIRRLEPRALIGRLTDQQILCLELLLRRAERLTEKNKVSRVLMADAWSKKDLDRWEAAVRRHLDEIDRSDADLAYIYARFLAQRTEEHIPDAIRWSNVALTNAHQWVGDTHVDRVYALHRINAVAAQRLWLAAEEDVLDRGKGQGDLTRANFWRNQTKSLSREWLAFAVAAGKDPAASLDLCMSAAGTTGYCEVQ